MAKFTKVWRSLNLGAFKLLGVAVCAVSLAGCALREDIAHSYKTEWQRAKTYPFAQKMSDFSGLSDVSGGHAAREAAADAKLCLHSNGSNRIISQQGIEDTVSARRCAVSPYPRAGLRLGGR